MERPDLKSLCCRTLSVQMQTSSKGRFSPVESSVNLGLGGQTPSLFLMKLLVWTDSASPYLSATILGFQRASHNVLSSSLLLSFSFCLHSCLIINAWLLQVWYGPYSSRCVANDLYWTECQWVTRQTSQKRRTAQLKRQNESLSVLGADPGGEAMLASQGRRWNVLNLEELAKGQTHTLVIQVPGFFLQFEFIQLLLFLLLLVLLLLVVVVAVVYLYLLP